MPITDFKNNRYLKYTGLVMQIFISLAIAAYIGKWLDHKFGMTKPILTAICSIAMLVMLLFWLNYDLKKQEQ